VLKPDLLVLGKVNSYLKKLNCNNYHVTIFPELDSTNTYILNNVNILKNQSVIVAEMQTHGRGRFANKWHSQNARGLTVSLLKFFTLDLNLETLPLVVAIAIVRLFKHYNVQTKIKWPNDICDINAAKIAGILLESGILSNQRYVVIGIGINDNLKIERSLFLASLIKELDMVINEFLITGFSLLLEEWLANCIHHGKMIGIYQNGQLVANGVNIGVNRNGSIMLQTADTAILEYSTASIRFEI
jgi:BirA family transcriptional regulator, biotin operon repressor / biotin---[acetyl-CoA-carboxylase] ligase